MQELKERQDSCLIGVAEEVVHNDPFSEHASIHETTNLFVSNISPDTTEEELLSAFRVFGEVTSIKVMWPRTAEERSRGHNSGFVAFVHRDDAQEAKVCMCVCVYVRVLQGSDFCYLTFFSGTA